MKSKRVRRKVAAVFFGDSHSSILQKCSEDLDWAMKEFDVSERVACRPNPRITDLAFPPVGAVALERRDSALRSV